MKKEYSERLALASSFDEIFELVKKIVSEELGMRRAGLGLILMDLPSHVGAFHYIGSNVIVINRSLLDAISKLSKDKIEINSYVFVVLLHEYLHSLGITDELYVRALVEKIVKEFFGEEHPTNEFIKKPIDVIYPKLKLLSTNSIGENVEVVKDFDTENAKYIS